MITKEHLAGSDSLRLPSNPKVARAALRLAAHWEELCVKDNAPTYLGWSKPLSDKDA